MKEQSHNPYSEIVRSDSFQRLMAKKKTIYFTDVGLLPGVLFRPSDHDLVFESAE